MRRPSKVIATSATIIMAVAVVVVALLASLQPALTSELARREQFPAHIEVKPNVQVS